MLARWVVLLNDVMHMRDLRFLHNVFRVLLNIEILIMLHQAPIQVNFPAENTAYYTRSDLFF